MFEFTQGNLFVHAHFFFFEGVHAHFLRMELDKNIICWLIWLSSLVKFELNHQLISELWLLMNPI